MSITAQKLILDLVSAAAEEEVTVRAVVLVAELFNITENSVRVALARLVDRGRLRRLKRGRYGISPGAQPVQEHVSSWATLEERRVAWSGDWCGVYLSPLGGGGRRRDRGRRRALEFLGLRPLEPALWVRPDNRVGGVAAVRSQLAELGLDPGSRVFRIGDLDAATEKRARTLWDRPALERAYRAQTRALERSAEALPKMALEEAVVESFIVGGQAINLLAFDPLLPNEILPAKPRRELVKTMRRYNRLGRGCWRTFASERGVPEIVMPQERQLDPPAIPPAGRRRDVHGR